MYIKKGHNHKGTKNPMYGKKHSTETKKKISDKMMGKTWKLSIQAKKYHSVIKKKWWDNHSEMRLVWSKNQSGDKGSNWQGGKTIVALLDRRGIKYKNWRTAVFERDNYECVLCGYRGNKLQADHIKIYSQYPELRYEVSNGRTLCIDCHKKTDTWGGLTKFKKHYV